MLRQWLNQVRVLCRTLSSLITKRKIRSVTSPTAKSMHSTSAGLKSAVRLTAAAETSAKTTGARSVSFLVGPEEDAEEGELHHVKSSVLITRTKLRGPPTFAAASAWASSSSISSFKLCSFSPFTGVMTVPALTIRAPPTIHTATACSTLLVSKTSSLCTLTTITASSTRAQTSTIMTVTTRMTGCSPIVSQNWWKLTRVFFFCSLQHVHLREAQS